MKLMEVRKVMKLKQTKKNNMEYRKKPIVIKAVKYDGNFRCLDVFSIHEVKNFIVGTDDAGNPCLKIPTLEGVMIASKGDYIIRGVKGEYYPCKPDIFEMTYELASTSSQTEVSDNVDTIMDLAEKSRNALNDVAHLCSGEVEEHIFDMGFYQGYKAKDQTEISDEEIEKKADKETSIEWLIKELKLEGYDHTIKVAKKMYDKEIDECSKKNSIQKINPQWRSEF